MNAMEILWFYKTSPPPYHHLHFHSSVLCLNTILQIPTLKKRSIPLGNRLLKHPDLEIGVSKLSTPIPASDSCQLFAWVLVSSYKSGLWRGNSNCAFEWIYDKAIKVEGPSGRNAVKVIGQCHVNIKYSVFHLHKSLVLVIKCCQL